MTRRIALSMMALVTLIVMLAVVPLGCSAADRERASFRSDAADVTRSVSAVAEEHLSDHHSDAETVRLVGRLGRHGDCASVYDASGAVVVSGGCSGMPEGGLRGLVASVLARPGLRVEEEGRRLTTAVAIVGDTGKPVGVAVLRRPVDPLDNRIRDMWGSLLLAAFGELAGSVLLAMWLARWVGRPLRAVDAAARRLGEGALEVRAPTGTGPVEVRRLAATFNTMARRTEALVYGHRAVVADVSHQLRTPLAALRLRLDLLAAGLDDEETGAELADAQGEVARLSRLVDGLLAVARAENAVPHRVAVRVDDLIAERVAAWRPLANERGVRLVGHCRPGLTAGAGTGDLEQVLDNLIANSLDAVPDGGRIRIGALPGDGVVTLQVSDDGPGMTAAARETAFRRFGHREKGGSGLGLAIVHRLVTVNGGTAALSPSPEGGLVVLLTLPEFRAPGGPDETDG